MKKFKSFCYFVVTILICFYPYDFFKGFPWNLKDFLFYVFAAVITCGMAFWIYHKYSPNLQRRTRLILMGSIVIVSSLIFFTMSFTVMTSATGPSIGIVIFHWSVIAVMGYCLGESYRLLKN